MMVSIVAWIGSFFLEVFLFALITNLIYNFLWKNLITRYTLAYAGLLLMYNVMGWLFAFCIFWIYSLLDMFYDAFFGNGVERYTKRYVGILNNGLLISTIAVTSLCAMSIYKQEKDYWKNKRK
ncbi:MAG: hypothetical protein EBZ49_11565 [Proteobacteria bacterium]|nr:hypothetical protein [Pseudomonadota bacterium]